MMGSQPFRVTPAGPASAYQTFEIRTPKGPEFWRPATCEQVDCEAWRCGWVTKVPAGNADLITAVTTSGRPFNETTEPGAAEREFLFAPGTECFRSSTHRKPVRPELPQLFVVRDGDHRGNPRGTAPRIHQRPEDWVEHHQEVTAAVVERIERG